MFATSWTLCISFRNSCVSLADSSSFLNSENKIYYRFEVFWCFQKLCYTHYLEKTGNLLTFLESVIWILQVQQLTPHIQSALSDTCNRGLQKWFLLRELPEAWIPSWKLQVTGKRERGRERWGVCIRKPVLYAWELLSQKQPAWACALPLLKNGIMLGWSQLMLLFLVFFSSLSHPP